MDARLQELWDHHEIRQLLAEYCHGCDRVDEIHMASVYCAESWDDHGQANRCDGREFARRMTADMAASGALCSHQLGQSLIRLHGDKAGAETYFVATVKYPGKDSLHQLGGRYIDTLERANGAWRIKKRTCVRDWSISHPIAADWLAEAGFVGPSPSQADPSYEALAMEHSGVPGAAVQ